MMDVAQFLKRFHFSEDITDVTFKYEWKPWSEVDDELLRARIIRDCIMF